MNLPEMLLIMGIIIGLPGLVLLLKFGILPEQNIDLSIPTDPSKVYLLEKRKKFARVAMSLMILSFGFLLCCLMLGI